MTENSKILALEDMLFDLDLIMTHALSIKNYFVIVTKDDEGLMLKWDCSLDTCAVPLILKFVRKFLSSNFGIG